MGSGTPSDLLGSLHEAFLVCPQAKSLVAYFNVILRLELFDKVAKVEIKVLVPQKIDNKSTDRLIRLVDGCSTAIPVFHPANPTFLH